MIQELFGPVKFSKHSKESQTEAYNCYLHTFWLNVKVKHK